MKKIDISIIIPLYNSEKTVASLIDKLDIIYKSNVEIILINDGSTDGTISVANDLIEEDGKFILINQMNSGPGAARNTGLDICRGEYIIFIDSDDDFDINMIDYMYLTAKKNNIDILQANYYTSDENLENIKLVECVTKDIKTNNKDEINKMFTIEKSISPYLWTKIFRREAVSSIRFSHLYYSEDQLFIIKVMNNNVNVMLIPESFYIYKDNPLSLVRGTFNYNQLDSIKSMKEIISFYELVDDKYTGYFYYRICKYIIYFVNLIGTDVENIDLISKLRGEYESSYLKLKEDKDVYHDIDFLNRVWLRLYYKLPMISTIYYRKKSGIR